MTTSILRVGMPIGLCLALASTGYSAAIVSGALSTYGVPLPVSSLELNTYTTPGVTRTGGVAGGEVGSTNMNILADGSNGSGTTSDIVTINGNTTPVRYSFATPQTVGSIDTFSLWSDGGRINQDYVVSYSTDNGTTFTPLATVQYDPSAGGIAKVSISTDDPSGILASNVTDVEFNFNTGVLHPQNGFVGYSELSINGVPEPTSLGLLALGGLGLLRRRRAAEAV